MKSPKKFLVRMWGWMAALWLLGALWVAFSVHLWLGIGFAAAFGLWFWHMGETTCSRCPAYGTGTCGVQSWLIPMFWTKRTLGSASRRRVRLHLYFDVLMMIFGAAVFAFRPVVLSFFILWLAFGWWAVYGPKQNHGLLSLLRSGSANEAERFNAPVASNAAREPGSPRA